MVWKKTITIRKFFEVDVDEHDVVKIQEISNNVLNELIKHPEYKYHKSLIDRMRNIKDGDVFSAEDYFNKLLNIIYDIADENRIWID